MEIILTHENADFDAIASLLAASKLFPAATPVLPRRVNRNCRAFLAIYGAGLPFIEPDEIPRGSQIGRTILVDTQSLLMVRGLTRETPVIVIDHHARDRDLPSHWAFSGEPLGATTTLLIEEIAGRALKLTGVEATLFLLGIHEDTGSLSYEGTTARDVRAAAWLMEQGAHLAIVNEFLHHPLTSEQRRLYEQLQAQSETHDVEGHMVIIASAEAPGFNDEISTLAHKLRDLLEPAALFVLVALDGGTPSSGRIQLVARSATDDIDVAAVAERFSGGGHARAAAALIQGRSLQQARAELLNLLPEITRPSITVGQIMSRGVQVLSPDDTIAEAAERMRRTGHEGYPVVSEGQVIGLLTRRIVDQALQHRMENEAVGRRMMRGAVTITPGDSVARLRQRMIESGWGQIPVVENGRIIGVVTRTDLITLRATPAASPRRAEIAALLERALSAPVLALVRRISQAAHEMGCAPYFVGGLVRDLLLGQPIVDVDMVIEGDAIILARRLATELGGRVRAHKRFGTAKWLLTEEVWRQLTDQAQMDGLPSSIDFVTARTEFYTHPTALPQVERSSIRQDLHRRDFTINTLAIRLDPQHWGELLDFYGGEADLRNGVIRVLHSLSFVDDPTRILRAARLESRMGFRLDLRSAELIADALPLLKRVSGDRIRHELTLIFREPEPELALARLEELGALAQIHPELRVDRWLRSKYHFLRTEQWNPQAWGMGPQDNDYLHLALLAYRLDSQGIQHLIHGLKVTRDDAADLRLLPGFKEILPQVGKARRPSVIYRLLEPYPARVSAVAWIATERKLIRERLWKYQTTWRFVQTELTGDDLKAMGLLPGPRFGQLLSALRDARLDGQIYTRAEELAWLQQLLANGENRRTP